MPVNMPFQFVERKFAKMTNFRFVELSHFQMSFMAKKISAVMNGGSRVIGNRLRATLGSFPPGRTNPPRSPTLLDKLMK